MSSIVVNGDTSGSVTLSAPATAGTVTVTLPSASGTMAVSGGSTSFTNLAYTGTLTGGTGVVNLGSGQVYKDASGNVGIGTSSPAVKLDVVNGSIRVNEDGAGTKVLTIRSNWAGVDPAINVTTNNPLLLMTNNTERARIDSSGSLYINQTSGINGTARVGVSQDCSVQAMHIWNNTAGGAATNNIVLFYRGATLTGYIQQTGTSTSYGTVSDYRLKDNIAPMTGALAKVSLLKPCTYKWKVDGSDGQGFIAHELAEVSPECVGGEKDAVDVDGNPQYQGIDTSFLVATLTAAIQELKAIVDAQGAEIAALKGAI